MIYYKRRHGTITYNKTFKDYFLKRKVEVLSLLKKYFLNVLLNNGFFIPFKYIWSLNGYLMVNSRKQ
jgi:hypothetical protein